MIARMPELSLIDTSVMLNPRRVSISSWFRIRSVPPFAVEANWLLSSIIAAHWAAISSLTVSTGAAAAAAPSAGSEASASPHSAASASWSTWFAMVLSPSLDHDFLEQHAVHLARRDGRVHPPGELFLEAVETRRAVEIGRPQLAQIGLKSVHDAGHHRLDLLHQRRIGQFEHQLDLEILSVIAARVGQVDQHLRHIEKDGRLRLRRRRMSTAGPSEHQIGGRSAAEHDDAPCRRHRDEFERKLAALRLGFAFGRIGRFPRGLSFLGLRLNRLCLQCHPVCLRSRRMHARGAAVRSEALVTKPGARDPAALSGTVRMQWLTAT